LTVNGLHVVVNSNPTVADFVLRNTDECRTDKLVVGIKGHKKTCFEEDGTFVTVFIHFAIQCIAGALCRLLSIPDFQMMMTLPREKK
jgi:hypothetical protein